MITIIIPIYNSEKYLRTCIDSVLVQSHTNFEILLINDGSTDGSGRICDEYAQKDSRIKVFHKENGGVSSARNVGLDYAKGEWICFVDSDDTVKENYLSNLAANIADADLIISGLIKRNSKKNIYTKEAFPEIICSSKDFNIYMQEYPLSNFGYPFSKLFKREILIDQKIRFNENVHMFEDVIFLFTYIRFCSEIKFISETDYNYMIADGGSLSTRVNKFESEYLGFISFYNLVLNEYKISVEELCTEYPELGYRLTRLMNRSISTLYLKKYPKKFCVTALKNYPGESWTLYQRFSDTPNILKKISKKLLINHRFDLADTILRTGYKIKK